MREKLEKLNDKVIRRDFLRTHLREMENEKEALSKELFSLKINAHNEQVDVDALNMFSLKNVFYAMTGKKRDLLEKEHSEARAAKERYQNAAFHFEQLLRRIEADKAEYISLQGCETEYWNCLCSVIDTSGSIEDMWIQNAYCQRAIQLSDICNKIMEAGHEAISYSEEVRNTLVNVRDWNRHLPDTSWYITMPGYFGGAMKKIEIFRKNIQIISEDMDVLPLPSQLIEEAKSMFLFPENLFRELTSRITADERLYDADAAIVTAVKRLQKILQAVETLDSELRLITA